MPCSRCGEELLAGKAFCHSCGAPAGPNCPSCASPVRPEFTFCPECGQALDAPVASPVATTTTRAELVRISAVETPRPPIPTGGAPQGPVAGERKQVTVLFCDLAGSTALASGLDPEDYRELLDEYLELAIREVDKRGGIVNQLAGDGFMALFGAPVSHEDEPAQSILAGLAIQRALQTFSPSRVDLGDHELLARIGIHTGPVVVGTVGNDLKMDYTAVGDTTNLAARIQQLADPGAVWVSATTHNLVAGRFEFEPIAPLAVKGKDEPIRAF